MPTQKIRMPDKDLSSDFKVDIFHNKFLDCNARFIRYLTT